MTDPRVEVFRAALLELMESIDATLATRRWQGPEPVPEEIKDKAARVIERLGAAERLSRSVFHGKKVEAARVDAIMAAFRQLETAYVAGRRSTAGTANGTGALEAALAAIRADKSWQRD
jgi:hypothetical protein